MRNTSLRILTNARNCAVTPTTAERRTGHWLMFTSGDCAPTSIPQQNSDFWDVVPINGRTLSRVTRRSDADVEQDVDRRVTCEEPLDQAAGVCGGRGGGLWVLNRTSPRRAELRRDDRSQIQEGKRTQALA
jgi:hypothetical protein